MKRLASETRAGGSRLRRGVLVRARRREPAVSPARPHRRADIQGLRGIAVLLVVAYHANLHVPGGFQGVDVFFVISGFVITGLLLRELESTGALRLGRFYARRARRLLPALAIMLLAVAAVGVLASPVDSQVTGAHTGIAASLFAANLYLYHLGTGYFDTQTTHDPLLHTWTLGVEEQFYVVFPVLLLACWLTRPGRRVAFGAIAAVAAASFALTMVLAQGGPSAARFAFYGAPTRAWQFGCGALLALAAPQLRSSRTVATIAGVTGGALVAAAAFAIHGTSTYVGWQMLLPTCGAAALLVAGLDTPTLATRALSSRPLVWMGDLSYSWYLWHWPVIVFLSALFPSASVAAAAAAVSLVPALLSFRYVEDPIRRGTRLVGRPALAIAAVCVVVPITACAGLIAANRLLARTAAISRWQATEQPYLSATRGCESTIPLDRRTGRAWARCRWIVPGAHGRLVLLGDSNAAQLSGPVVAAGTKAGYDVTLAPLSGCPFVDLRIVSTAGENEQSCHTFDAETLDALLRKPPAVVIIANRDDLTIDRPYLGFVSATGRATYVTSTKAALWDVALAHTLRSLKRAGVHVLLVRPVPAMPAAPTDCAVVRVLTHTCKATISRADVARALRLTVATETRAVVGTSTKTVSFENDLCGSATCSTMARDGTVLYRDKDHLTVAGAHLLTGHLYRLLTALPRRG